MFNAADWVKTAKDAGMRYIVFVSKHHDGFTMWDSKLTNYKITATPFGKDVLREISDECRKQGILFCTYYSIADWHNPLYATRHGSDSRSLDSANMPEYIKYMKAQLSELILNYGTNLLWFDGEWEGAWTHEAGMDLYKYCRSLNDEFFINNRVDKGRDGMKGKTVSEKYAGDFGTAEQEIGNYDNLHPWESCITICNQWSWKPNDSLKTFKSCMQMLVRSCGGGGNMLLNVSPMPDGRMELRQVNRLKEIGNWMAENGEVFMVRAGGPYNHRMIWFQPGKEIKYSCISWNLTQRHVPCLHHRKSKLISLKTMDGKDVNYSSGTGISISIWKALNPVDHILVMELDGPSGDLMISPCQSMENVRKSILKIS